MASKYAGIVQDELRDLRGNAMTGAVVIVREVGTTTPATVYNNPVLIASASGGDSLVNDASTGLPAASGLLQPGLDANGNYTFYADAEASYDLHVVWQGLTFDYRVRPKVVDEAYTSTADLTAALAGTFVGIAASETITGAKLLNGGLTVERPAAVGAAQVDGPIFTFGGIRRASISAQGTTDVHPHAGVVEVRDGGEGRLLQITHYQYGGTWRQTGPNGQIVEMWLGNDVAESGPNFSVRHNGSNKGAIVQARDAGDFSGIAFNFRTSARPKVEVEVSASLPSGTVMAIENGNASGKIAFATNSGSGLTDRVQITNAGRLGVGPSAPNQLLGVSGEGVGISIQDTTATTGRSYELLSGSVGAGRFSIYDRTAAAHRFTIETDGKITFAGALETAGTMRQNNATNSWLDLNTLGASSNAGVRCFVNSVQKAQLNRDEGLGAFRMFNDVAGSLTEFARVTGIDIEHMGHLTMANAKNIILNTSTGTKIGTAASQKLGFYNATPVVQPSATPAAATDLATVITLANDLRTKLLALGLAA